MRCSAAVMQATYLRWSGSGAPVLARILAFSFCCKPAPHMCDDTYHWLGYLQEAADWVTEHNAMLHSCQTSRVTCSITLLVACLQCFCDEKASKPSIKHFSKHSALKHCQSKAAIMWISVHWQLGSIGQGVSEWLMSMTCYTKAQAHLGPLFVSEFVLLQTLFAVLCFEPFPILSCLYTHTHHWPLSSAG